MATLVSPGVSVTITDESFYAGSSAGTIPLILIATASNKVSPTDSTAVATYSQSAYAGKLYLATSQRDLIQNFGTPSFKLNEGTAVHGWETNEYGLHAAYSFLGIANQAYVLRADLDLSQLEPSANAPLGSPAAGTYWLDLSATTWGVFQANGNVLPGSAWDSQTVLVASTANVDANYVPLASFGTEGAFAVVAITENNLIFEKVNGQWFQIGSTAWEAKHPTVATGTVNPAALTVGTSLSINGTTVTITTTSVSDLVTAINAAAITNVTAALSNGALLISNVSGGNLVLANGNGTPLAVLGLTAGTQSGVSVVWTNNASYPAGNIQGSVWVKGTSANKGAAWVVKYYTGTAWTTLTAPFYPFTSTLADGNALKDSAATTALGVPVSGTVYIGYDASTGAQQVRYFTGSIWDSLVYEADASEPTTAPADGTYWYDNNFLADLMVSDGTQWLAYRRYYPLTDAAGVLISASKPITQSTGAALVDNDLWLDSSDTENYPALYRWSATTLRWSSVDLTDHTTPFGLVFADARADSGTAFSGIKNASAYSFNSTAAADMLLSDFVDPDAPDPRLYPAGLMLFNTRYSTNNVKEWKSDYFALGDFDANTDYTTTAYTNGNPAKYTFPALESAGRWVTASGNNTSGAAYMGRKAQRAMIVRALAAQVTANQDIRSELVHFNLLAAPGYPELLPDLISLNTDQNEVSFIVGDTPIRLTPDATSVANWAGNAADAATTGEDGLVTSNDYAAIYYPWGLGADLAGNEVMIPPSTIALRTLAYNDQLSYPWFAPAGFQRGLVTNADSVGYLNSAGGYTPVILNQGQRDTLYTNRINPIAYIVNRGLVVYGQKTLAAESSALDRVNVSRLCCYVNYTLDNAVKPFLFEQNDSITQMSATNTVSRLLNGIVSQRGISDYAVLCNSSNNTSDRMDRNELWIDVLIKPIKAVEFIYVPVRIEAQGTDLNATLNSLSN